MILKSKIGKLVVISGPSGVGKSTIVDEVLAKTGAEYSVSVTTRKPRTGEVDGKDYRFVDEATFRQMVAQGQLLEWAEVFGNLYGTPAGPVRESIAAGRTVLLEIDVQGGLQVWAKAPGAVMILILPPSREELERRLRGRGSESPESLRRRLAKADEEISTAQASGAYNHSVVNGDLETAISEVVRIVKN